MMQVLAMPVVFMYLGRNLAIPAVVMYSKNMQMREIGLRQLLLQIEGGGGDNSK